LNSIILDKKGEIIIVEIKLIGATSKNGLKMKKIIERTMEDSDIDINLLLLDDDASKNKYNVKNYPGIVVNGNLVSQGKVLTERELKKVLV